MTSPQAPVMPGAATLPSGLSSKSRRQRRWSLALAGVLLIVGSGMVFLLVFVNAGDREPVLAIAREVPAGQVISGSDLQIVRVGADAGVSTISEARRSDVVGQTAAVDLIPGTLLVEEQLGEPVSLAAGDSIVGLDLIGGERAVPDLQEGDEVLIVLTAPASSTESSGDDDDEKVAAGLGEVITRGRVTAVVTSEDAEERVMASVIVPEELAEGIAGANSVDRIALVVVPPQ